MKILWVGPNFLHPTTKGGQIRTLGILRQLARWHEIHYVAYEDPAHPEGPHRATEYCRRAYPFRHAVLDKRSLRFAGQVAAGLFRRLPLAISRYRAAELKQFLEKLIHQEQFDRMVVDFLVMTASCPRLEQGVLFQHNVETMIWRRHAGNAPDPLRRLYFRIQAGRMCAFERAACRRAGHIVAVSDIDAGLMRTMFGVERISTIPTGVDLEYFAPPAAAEHLADFVFVGSMDWLPNVDAVFYFVREILPLIRRRSPNCTFAIVGRTPPPEVIALGQKDAGVRVTGTVADVRPYLWGASVAVVPLRIGGGTRLKIYEAMAARIPVVSTTIGAEGLAVHPPADIRIADRPEELAERCLELLQGQEERQRVATRAWALVAGQFSWERVARRFAEVLEAAPTLRACEFNGRLSPECPA